MAIKLIDSHCHLDFPVFDANRSELIKQCNAAGIGGFIVPGVTAENWPRLVELQSQFAGISIAFGLHPYFIEQHTVQDLDLLSQYCEKYQPVAIGEIGLDYYRKDLDKTKQLEFFQRQLELANAFQLPVILHVRKAHQDVLTLLKKTKVKGGVVHAFSGSEEQAREYIKLGFMLGFGGAITYPNASKLKKLACTLPLDCMVLETDSPDMKPFEYTEQANTPLTLIRVLDEISELRGEKKESLAMVFLSNTQRIFS